METLQRAYSAFDPDSDTDYSKDETFLRITWSIRDQLSPEAVEHIFSDYQSSQEAMGSVLRQAEKRLKSFGLKVTTAGRDFARAAERADLILIDLYLGSQHSSDDMEQSIQGLRSAIEAQRKSPPAIILMSSHPNVVAKRGKFRDEARVFASGFRAIRKADIDKEGRVDQMLFELAQHRQDSLKLTSFLETWREGIQRAMDATSHDIRRLDLEDIAQLQNLLLDDEQALRGSYMLDLVDRLLLHDIEADKPTIASAKKLNTMDSDEHPPNTITETKDNLQLIQKTLYIHPSRRDLDSPDGYPVAFGDIIALRDGAKAPPGSIFAGARTSVFAVMTPACDLLRDPPSAKRVLLIEGECKPVDAVAYSPPMPGDADPRTIVLLHGKSKVGVAWKTKRLATLTKTVMENLIAKDGVFVAGRLRSEYALELQQAMLSGVGRVGNMAPMPSNYPIVATVYYPDNERNFVPLNIKLNGMCVIGRASDKKVVRIGFDSIQRHDFADALRSVVNNVNGRSRDRIRQCLSPECINALFTEGFACDIGKASSKHVPCKPRLGSETQQIGTIVYASDADAKIQDPGQRQSAGLIFEVMENR
ncbi:hypothetical protein ACFQEX_03855 [Roseibium salinum]|uniref:hypothetical protein n=1 Tax=Roseibium salinum TaxID=1604349 RepID=UPI00361435CA